MALTTKLELRQGQQLVMTPQLQQAIRLLQLSNLELTQFVDLELERNPLLERDEADEPPPRATGTDEPVAERGSDSGGDGSADDVGMGEGTGIGESSGMSEGPGLDEPWLDLARAPADPAVALDTDLDKIRDAARPAAGDDTPAAASHPAASILESGTQPVH